MLSVRKHNQFSRPMLTITEHMMFKQLWCAVDGHTRAILMNNYDFISNKIIRILIHEKA